MRVTIVIVALGLLADCTTQAKAVPACTDNLTGELAAHFESKGWNDCHFSCV